MKEFIFITDINMISGDRASYIIRREDIIAVGVNDEGNTQVIIRHRAGVDAIRLFSEKLEVSETVDDIYRQLS